MEKEIENYVKNFYLFRKNKKLDVDELLDVTIFIMIESNEYYDTIVDKEAFILGVMKSIIDADIVDLEANQFTKRYMEHYVATLKKQLLKNTKSYCSKCLDFFTCYC